MARAEPAVVDIHGATWDSPDEYKLVPSAQRYEVYEMSMAGKVTTSLTNSMSQSLLYNKVAVWHSRWLHTKCEV